MYYNSIEEELNSRENISFFMIDLNDLKSVNDRMGHLMGDKYIEKFAEILKNVFEDNIKIRMGGDEFLIISDICDEKEADKIISELREKLNVTFVKNDKTFIMGISFAAGYACKESFQTAEEAIALADKRMYENKRFLK